MGKSLGIKGAILVGGVDYECEAGNLKMEQEKVEVVGIGSDGWTKQVPGGVKKVTGQHRIPV